MLEELQGHLGAMRELLAAMDPATLDPASARELLEVAVAIERLGRGLEFSVAPRAVLGAPWAEEGHRCEASWLAEQLHSSVPEAISLKECAERLETLPAAAAAVRAGELSSTEARALAVAACADPGSEAELLEAALTLPTGQWLRYARLRAQAARSASPEHKAQMSARRYLNFWSDAEGMFRLSGALLPEDGVDLVGSVRSMAAHLGAEARRAGECPSDRALAADALVGLVRGDRRWATFEGPRAELPPRGGISLLVDATAVRRGHLQDGEACEVPGVGPVGLELFESLVGDVPLATVIKDGVDVLHVTHHGRLVSTHLRTALAARDPTCVVPECRVALGLEIDHWQIPFSEGGPTALWNLARLCRTHHRMKTYDGYVLAGGPGEWEWLPPG